jgi:16S rRNA (cytidine1402-2'-O)-methyltransferase
MDSIKPGTLTLFNTPIAQKGYIANHFIEFVGQQVLENNAFFLVEDHKTARNRWLAWQGDRRAIDTFLEYNEHNSEEQARPVIERLLAGESAILMSDGGAPCLCDPGARLVSLCHQKDIKVQGINSNCSIVEALVLSGMDSTSFIFSGFPPRKPDDRQAWFRHWVKQTGTLVLMDTPYRLRKTLQEIAAINDDQIYFLGLNFDELTQWNKRARPTELLNSLPVDKAEFVLVKGRSL